MYYAMSYLSPLESKNICSFVYRLVYLYRQSSDETWAPVSTLSVSTLNAGMQFGKALAMDRAGRRLIVGAPSDGTEAGKPLKAKA